MSEQGRLVVRDLVKRYGDSEVLSGVCLVASPGETLAIVGPSGSGKSTLLNIVGSLDTPTAGAVQLGEIDVTALSGAALCDFRARRVGFVFQDHQLLPQLTAAENVLLPTLARGKPDVSDGSDSSDASELLQRVGVAHRADAFPAQMSGGERQRVAVARALVNRPDLLLCDEPTGNLDAATGSGIVDLLLEIARDRGVTVLVVTHNADHAARFSRTLTMRDGLLVSG